MTKDAQYIQDFIFAEMQRCGDETRIKQLNVMYHILSGAVKVRDHSANDWEFYVGEIDKIVSNRIMGMTKVMKDLK